MYIEIIIANVSGFMVDSQIFPYILMPAKKHFPLSVIIDSGAP
jgi:hypothetical protein